jgi:hypothetical protein
MAVLSVPPEPRLQLHFNAMLTAQHKKGRNISLLSVRCCAGALVQARPMLEPPHFDNESG